MSKVIVIILLMSFYSWQSYARCDGRYANHLIEARYKGCKKDIKEQILNIESLSYDISSVCKECYSAIFNADLVPECDRKYAAALNKYSSQITQIASKAECSDSGSYTSKKDVVSEQPGTADASCRWLYRTTSTVTCGGQRSGKLCGNGGRNICAGEVLCTDFNLSGKKFIAGAYVASCSTDESCNDVKLETCFNDPNLTPVKDETHIDSSIFPALNRVRGVN